MGEFSYVPTARDHEIKRSRQQGMRNMMEDTHRKMYGDFPESFYADWPGVRAPETIQQWREASAEPNHNMRRRSFVWCDGLQIDSYPLSPAWVPLNDDGSQVHFRGVQVRVSVERFKLTWKDARDGRFVGEVVTLEMPLEPRGCF